MYQGHILLWHNSFGISLLKWSPWSWFSKYLAAVVFPQGRKSEQPDFNSSAGADAEQDAAIKLAQERAEIVAKYDRVSELFGHLKDIL